MPPAPGERDQADRHPDLHEGAESPRFSAVQGYRRDRVGVTPKKIVVPCAAHPADGRDPNPEEQRVLVPLITYRCQRLEVAGCTHSACSLSVGVSVGAGSGDGEDDVGRVGLPPCEIHSARAEARFPGRRPPPRSVPASPRSSCLGAASAQALKSAPLRSTIARRSAGRVLPNPSY